MPTGESSETAEVCRPCPLSKLGCGPEAGPGAGHEPATCSAGPSGLVFVLPLGTAVLGAGLAQGLLGGDPSLQIVGALAGLVAGVALAVRALRALDRIRRSRS
jgi:hypothetical protein